MRERVEQYILRHELISPGDKVLIGLSGGGDSVALLHILKSLCTRMGFTICAAHLNHGIRGEAAHEDAEFVHDLCDFYGIRAYGGYADIPRLARQRGETLEQAGRMLRYDFLEEAKAFFGADKIAVNSAAIDNPGLILNAALKFGSQCVVLAVDAKRNEKGGWNVYKHGGRIDTGLDALEWIARAEKLGAGEILLTSMDRDGTKAGYDIPLTKAVSKLVNIPVIASGGAGTKEHFSEVLTEGGADAALAASLFHFGELRIKDLKIYLSKRDIPVRGGKHG